MNRTCSLIAWWTVPLMLCSLFGPALAQKPAATKPATTMPTDKLVGQWRCETKNGAETYLFQADGKLAIESTLGGKYAFAGGTWKRDGDKLGLKIQRCDDGKESSRDIALLVKAVDDKKVVLARADAPEQEVPYQRVRRTMKFAPTAMNDVHKNLAAYILIPDGWKLEAQIAYSVQDERVSAPVDFGYIITNPDGAEQYCVSSGTWAKWMPSYEPKGLTGKGVDGLLALPPPESAAAAILDNIIKPRMQHLGVKEYKVIDTQERPLATGKYPRLASILVEYTLDKRPVVEFYRGILNVTVIVPNGPLAQTRWSLRGFQSVRAEKGKLLDQVAPLELCRSSIQPNPAWTADIKHAQEIHVEAMVKRGQQHQDFLRKLHEENMQQSDNRMKDWSERNKVKDEAFDNWVNAAIKDVEPRVNPYDGIKEEIPTRYYDSNVWVDPKGLHVVSDDPSFDPNVALRGDYKLLEKPAKP